MNISANDKKVTGSNLRNWILGNIICTLGVCLATKAGFGLSMIGAGPYILHIWLRDSLTWFTQGTAEYVYEALVLIAACIIIKRFRLSYLLSFGEAVIAGLLIDGWLMLFGGNAAYEELSTRIIVYILSVFVTALGVAFFFRTTLPLQTYDFAVVKITEAKGIPQHRVKQFFDLSMLTISLMLSFALTGKLTGIGIGTVISTIVNAPVINGWGKLIDKVFAEK